MLKDTKSLGNNKAPACESRGFVRKRKKGCILTHLHATIEDKLGTKIRKTYAKKRKYGSQNSLFSIYISHFLSENYRF